VLAVLLLLSLALYPRLRGSAAPAGPEPAPELREGEPAPTARVEPNVVQPQRTREPTDAPSHRRR
jgi:putative amide transporter protein